jgi:hypothetical protein
LLNSQYNPSIAATNKQEIINMNRAYMPAFTAEASLCNTSGRYRVSAAQSHGNGDRGVISQMRAGGGGTIGGTRTGFWCEAKCTAIGALCNAACAAELNPLCIAACIATEISCLTSCDSFAVGGSYGVGIA